jgi:protein SCO1
VSRAVLLCSRLTVLFGRRRARRVAALAALMLAAAGCGNSSPGPPVVVSAPSAGAYRGDELDPPVSLSGAAAVPFTTDDGRQVTLADLQAGHLMLVYFGYTHCPDVCPTTMADLGDALRSSPAAVQQATRVVFVSSDPERDTPSVLRPWLANFDHGLPAPFVGLTGPISGVDTAAKTVGVPLEPPTHNPDGTVTVDHGAQLLAFRTGRADVVWLAGTPAADYAHDLALLTKELNR